jgi:hypothetical protein
MIRRLFLFLSILVFGLQPVAANWCAIPGRNGSVSISGIVNTYWGGAASVSAGSASISLSYARGAPVDIQPGDLLLVIQMQDTEFVSSNDDSYGSGTPGGYGNGYTDIRQAGRYEFVRATSNAGQFGGTVNIQGATGGGLVHSYVVEPYSNTGFRKSFQVVRVPQYDEALIVGPVTASPWDGEAGGIVALDVARRLTFAGGGVDVKGLGFRGGAGRNLGNGQGASTDFATPTWNGANGQKGEGVAGAPWFVAVGDWFVENRAEGYPGGGSARGAPGNAGGGGTDGFPYLNIENSGGGGGGNGGEGGQGGHAWCSSIPQGCAGDQENPAKSGGHPGARIVEAGADRLVMGGGGGAGTNNDATGTPGYGLSSSGAAGGGIVFIRAGEIAGSGPVVADGADANSTAENDGSGGGGAGGSVLIAAVRAIGGGGVSVSARGGNGGSNTAGGSTAHGPGGGGGGGYVASSIPVSADLGGGRAGTTRQAPASFGLNYGAGDGAAGRATTIATGDVPGVSSGGECTPHIIKSFDVPEASLSEAFRLRVEVRNNNPTLALTDVAFTDAYPADLVNADNPAPANSCATGNLSAAGGGNSLSVSDATIPAGGSCTYSTSVMAPSAGEKANRIEIGDLTATYGLPEPVSNLGPATATVRIYPPLSMIKTAGVGSDPLNGTTNPAAIPGSLLAYTITLNGHGGSVTGDSIVVMDATPANVALFLGDMPGGTGPFRLIEGATPSGLTLAYDGPSSTSDDVSFSSDGGQSWTYEPVPGANGADPTVTHVRFNPKGVMTPGSTFSLYFGYIIQ